MSLLPENDQWSETKSQLLAQMDVCMGGRVAEELVFGPDNITTGASSDFEQATKIAHLMVTKFGMSEKVGLSTHSLEQEPILFTPNIFIPCSTFLFFVISEKWNDVLVLLSCIYLVVAYKLQKILVEHHLHTNRIT